MIYKFEQDSNDISLEIKQTEPFGDKVCLTIYGNCEESIIIDENQLYDLIGALHSIKNKIGK